MINLIATPEKYHGEKVQLVGYMVLAYEEQAIYLSKLHSDNGMLKNGLVLWLEDEQTMKLKDLNWDYVLIERVFDAELKGPAGLYSGTLKEITRLEPAINRSDESWKSRVRTIK
jgi:hypothetical protein